MKETVVTSKGTTTIPQEIREQAGVVTGTRLVWSLRNGVIEARIRFQARNTMQEHILARAGQWDGYVSGAELLRRTRS